MLYLSTNEDVFETEQLHFHPQPNFDWNSQHWAIFLNLYFILFSISIFDCPLIAQLVNNEWISESYATGEVSKQFIVIFVLYMRKCTLLDELSRFCFAFYLFKIYLNCSLVKRALMWKIYWTVLSQQPMEIHKRTQHQIIPMRKVHYHTKSFLISMKLMPKPLHQSRSSKPLHLQSLYLQRPLSQNQKKVLLFLNSHQTHFFARTKWISTISKSLWNFPSSMVLLFLFRVFVCVYHKCHH